MSAPCVAVLFARSDSNYKAIDGCDVWDVDRDARKWPGGCQVVAHPPCRAWGRLRHFAKPRDDEKDLALFAVDQVRRYGGVLEHPAGSSLWCTAGLPRPDEGEDAYGGWSLSVKQMWWGHRAEKATWLYIVGCGQREIPQIPFIFGCRPSRFVGARTGFKKGMPGWMPDMRTAERESTPPELAAWLVDQAAHRCGS